MASIFDLRLVQASNSIHISPVVFLCDENVGDVVGISLLSYVEAEVFFFYAYFRFMTAVLISGSNTVSNCTSSKTHSDALPFGENHIKKSYPFQRKCGGFWKLTSQKKLRQHRILLSVIKMLSRRILSVFKGVASTRQEEAIVSS